MKSQSPSPDNTPLIPFADFQKIAAKVLSVSKEESDKQLRQFQAANPKSEKNKPKRRKGKKAA